MGQKTTLSRPTTSGFGKCTESAKTLVPFELKHEFTRAWREAGYPSEGDCLRELIFAFTYGAKRLQKIHTERIERIAESLAGIGTEGD